MARRTETYSQGRKNKRSQLEGMTPDEKIVQEAKDRFKRAEDWESEFWRLYVTDVKFANGDSDNGWQWPDDLRKDREVNKRPTLTVNKVGPMCRLITNDQRQNKSSVTIRPANEQASYDAAQVFEGLVRQIEYQSNAQATYDDAGDSQVEGGIGYWRVNTRYVEDDSFDQECTIDPVSAHRNVYLDCDIKQRDGSDAKWALMFDDLPDEEFEDEYPDADTGASTGLGVGDDWIRDGYTRVAEYYRLTETDDELIWVEDEHGNSATFKKSEMPDTRKDELAKIEKEDPDKIKRRPIRKKQLEWYKIAGNEIVDRRKLKGKYIPLVRVVGIERVIDGKLERKGHVRTLKDQQRMYNYNSSGQVEFGALQTKTPWVIAAAAIQGQETAWNNANRSNAAYLTYRHMDKDGNPLPAPVRNAAPGESPAFVTGMEVADRELAMASGQYNANQGKEGQEKSGRAILQRQRQGDTAVYHFIDNMALAIRHTGKILIDLIPLVYNTERVQQILGKDGKQQSIKIDPKAEQAYAKSQEDKGKVAAIFNPVVGRYEVESDPGPSYATRRQEAWNAFVQIITGSPELINDIGDYMFQTADFPLADKIAERLRAKIRATQPWLLDDEAPSPAMQKIQQELQQATQQIGELLEKLADGKRALKSKDQKRDIEAYRAESDRVHRFGTVVKDLVGDPQSQRLIITAMQQVVRDIYGENIAGEINREQGDGPVGHADLQPNSPQQQPDLGDQGNDEQPPVPNARKAADGNWYTADPSRPGKYARVMTEAKNAA